MKAIDSGLSRLFIGNVLRENMPDSIYSTKEIPLRYEESYFEYRSADEKLTLHHNSMKISDGAVRMVA